MMEPLFLLCWTGLFLAGLFFIRRKIVSRIRLYLLLLLNLIFLAGIFYFYPVIKGDVSVERGCSSSAGEAISICCFSAGDAFPSGGES